MKTFRNQTSTIELKDFFENVEMYMGRIKAGESFVVVKHALPVFMLTPIETEGVWRTGVDFTEEHPEGVSVQDITRAIKLTNRLLT